MPFALVVCALVFAALDTPSPRVALPQNSPTTLVVHVEGMRSAAGSIHVGFYRDATQWKTEKSDFQRHGRKSASRDGRVTFTFTDVPPGRYAAAIVDDENDNGGMDWGLLLPKEGFGFSNYYHRGLTRPDFDDFDFELPAGGRAEVTFRVRYL